jgi:Sec-independent protein secretion pathway component TatC
VLTLFQIGVGEVAILLITCLAIGVLGAFRASARRWLLVVAPILAVAMICTPADPVSMLIVAVPACILLAAGVVLAPYLRVT